jgi:plastocyanin domain-containing protein
MNRILAILIALALLVTPLVAATPRTIDVKISGGFYEPKVVNVKKGETVRLRFTRDAKPTCGDEIAIPALKIKQKVAKDTPTVIEITPKSDLKFTCGMDMMEGKIVVE